MAASPRFTDPDALDVTLASGEVGEPHDGAVLLDPAQRLLRRHPGQTPRCRWLPRSRPSPCRHSVSGILMRSSSSRSTAMQRYMRCLRDAKTFCASTPTTIMSSPVPSTSAGHASGRCGCVIASFVLLLQGDWRSQSLSPCRYALVAKEKSPMISDGAESARPSSRRHVDNLC